jgi:hypothetical protein
VLEDDPALALEMLVEGDAVADAAQEFGEHCLAAFTALTEPSAPSSRSSVLKNVPTISAKAMFQYDRNPP